MKQDDEWDYGPFKVGDVVEGYGFLFDIQHNGMSAVIADELRERNTDHRFLGPSLDHSYLVIWANGEKNSIEPQLLRRRKPPMTGLQDVLAMFDKQPDRVKEVA